MAADIDHDRIREVEDRSWTARLLETVRDPSISDEDRAAAFATLRVLEDHRSIAPLTAMLEDTTLPEGLRRQAAAVLDATDDTTTLTQRIAWWESDDDLLRAHALGQMGRFEAEVVIGVAGDDHHPLQVQALEAMAFDFEEAAFAPVLIRALAHPDAAVRHAAADALVWGEPAAAEEPLLVAAADEDPDVAEAALYALEYYPTRRVLRAVAELEPHADEDVRDQAEWTVEVNRGRFEALGEGGGADERRLLGEWLAPVSDLVDWAEVPDEDADDDEASGFGGELRGSVALPVPAYEIQAMLSDPDGEWAERLSRLRQVDWAGHSEQERQALRGELDNHPDPDIRDIATAAFSAWGDRDALVLQMLDDSETVRKSATYQLGLLDRDEALAPILWARMLGATGTAAYEALQAYVNHAGPDEAAPKLAELARTEPRDSVRTQAIASLAEIGARDEIEGLVPLLREPPAYTWAAHIQLLQALLKFDIPVSGLEEFAGVDHLDVAGAVAALRSAVDSR